MISSIKTFLYACALIAFMGTSSLAFEKEAFEKLAKDTIKQVISGSIADIDGLIAIQEKMIALGVEGCKMYVSKAPDAKDKKIMELVIGGAEKMKGMTMDEIEEAWHDGGVLGKNGIDADSIGMGQTMSLMDSVIHPATTYIALKEYKKTKDKALLDQVKDELTAVLEHNKMIKTMPH
ncbi:MAG: hypothetical protein V3S16_09160 [Candidatus Desulfatibia sp.]|uniref:hypothetical protein n=1 Tax=Candidatus Desulfatibia sp. TaxID=3101189 RepID=UPI002F34ADE6